MRERKKKREGKIGKERERERERENKIVLTLAGEVTVSIVSVADVGPLPGESPTLSCCINISKLDR